MQSEQQREKQEITTQKNMDTIEHTNILLMVVSERKQTKKRKYINNNLPNLMKNIKT